MNVTSLEFVMDEMDREKLIERWVARLSQLVTDLPPECAEKVEKERAWLDEAMRIFRVEGRQSLRPLIELKVIEIELMSALNGWANVMK